VILSIILLFSSSIYLRAQEETGQPAQLEPAEKNKVSLTALPILYYTPETKLAFGAGGLLTFRLGLVFKEARPSTLFLPEFTLR